MNKVSAPRNNLFDMITDLKNPRNYLILFAIIILYLVALTTKNPFAGDILTNIFMFAALSLSWNLLGGYGGQFSLGHAGLFGIGAYVSTIVGLHFDINPWLAMLIGGLTAAFVGGLVFYPCFRLTGIFFCLASLAFTEVLRILAIYFRGITNGSMGITIPFKAGFANLMFQTKMGYMLLSLSFMLIIAFVSYFFSRSRLGYKTIAVRENEETAEALGINSAQTKLIATLISAFFTGCIGTFYARYTLLVDPDSVFSVMLSVEFALLAILGGIGTVFGPIIGAFLLVPIDSLMRGGLGQAQQGLSFFAYGTLLVIVVIFLPKGFVSWVKPIANKVLKKLNRVELKSMVPDVIGQEKWFFVDRATLKKQGNTALLRIDSIDKSYGGLQVISNLSMDINSGEIMGVIGPNGAGKTTLFNLISGFTKCDAGKINFNGADITNLHPPHKVSKIGIARTFQIVKPFEGLTVLENIVAGAAQRADNINEAQEISSEVLSIAGLKEYSNTIASSLTLVSRKRLELARALATGPKLLLLDEVMAGLNPTEVEQTTQLIKKIAQQGITIMIIEHVMKAIMSLANRVVVIDHGVEIFIGSPQDARNDEKVISAYLGSEISLHGRDK